MGFDVTRQMLLDVARETFDPDGEHLPTEATSFHGGVTEGAHRIGTKLSWINPDESGEGMVYVGVTSPGFAEKDHAIEDFAFLAGNGDFAQFTEEKLPGTSQTGWVYQGGTGDDLRLGVFVERADGSLVGIGVYGLFGNNSLTGVSDIGIDLEAAAAYVTDPRLAVHDDDLATNQQWDDFVEWLLDQDSATQQQVVDQLKAERDDLAMELPNRLAIPADKLEEWGLVNESGWSSE
jgi:hypothetical protein